jgi:protein-disulfide isomerase
MMTIMSSKPKPPVKFDPKGSDRKRNLVVQLGLTAVVVLFAVGLVLYIVTSKGENQTTGQTEAIRVASSSLITKDGSNDPKAILSLYEDFQCPHCRQFEQTFGPTIQKLIDSGAVAADYYMVAILNSPANQNYSTRSANAAYCVGNWDKSPNKEAFTRFHSALFAQQPPEGSAAPDNAGLLTTARLAGVTPSDIADCVNSGKYSDMVNGLAAAAKITATPTIRLNGQDVSPSSPDDLVAKVKAVVGNVPGL